MPEPVRGIYGKAREDPAMRDRIAQMPGVDIKLFDTPEARRNTLDGLVREQVLLQTRDEVPYRTATVAESFEERPAQGLIVIAVLLDQWARKALAR